MKQSRKIVTGAVRTQFLFGLMLFAGIAFAETDTIQLAKPNNGSYWQGQETIRIQLPSLQRQQLASARLIVEMDSVDISEMLNQEGDEVLYTPLQPLAPGSHELRLVYYGDDGSIDELAVWSLEVRALKLLKSYQVSSNTQLSAVYRVDEKNIPQPLQDRMQGQGSSQIGFNTAGDTWRSNGQFDLYYNSLNSQDGDDNTRPFDVGEFLVEVDSPYLGAKFGHHSQTVHSLVMEGFHRRGVSIQGKAPTLQSRATGFAYSADDVQGFGEGLGISDHDNRVQGVILESNPLPGHEQLLYVSATHLTGRRPYNPYFDPDMPLELSEGSAQAITLQSHLFDKRLQLQAEYANTKYDFSTSDSLAGEHDDAHAASLIWQSFNHNGLFWHVGLEHQKIGTFFKSMANETLVSDKQQQRLFGGLQWRAWGLLVSLIKQHDNVEDLDALPTIETHQRTFTLSWAPQRRGDGLLGTPSLNFTWATQDQEQIHTPLDNLSPEVGNQLDSWTASADFNYDWGRWGGDISSSEFDDETTPYNNSCIFSYALSADYSHGEWWSVSSSYRQQRIDYQGAGEVATNTQFELVSRFQILPQRLDGSLQYNLNHNEIDNDLQDNETDSLSVSLDWTLRHARNNTLGFLLSLSGQFNHYDDRLQPVAPGDDRQVFLTLTSTLPSTYER